MPTARMGALSGSGQPALTMSWRYAHRRPMGRRIFTVLQNKRGISICFVLHLNARQRRTDNHREAAMGKQFQVEANGTVFGIYEADDEQAARDACAVDAGYKSEDDMVRQLGQPSELVATEK
jgi:hypothetical protein